MNSPASPPDLLRIGGCALAEVLDTQLALSIAAVTPEPPHLDRPPELPVLGTVQLHGDRLTADVRLQVPVAFAHSAARRLLQPRAPEAPLDDACLDDLVGELCNMIAGRVAASLHREGYPSELAPPVVARRAHFGLESVTDRERCRTHWSCEGHRLTLEIQCRYPPTPSQES